MSNPGTRKIARWCEATFGFIASAALFAMMLLTFVDVVGRYFFSAPVVGGMEVVEVLLVLTVFAGLPLAALQQGHIEIDVLAACFSPGVWTVLGKIGHAMFAAALACVSYLLAMRAQQLAFDGEVTSILSIPVFAVAWCMVVLTSVAALLHFANAVWPAQTSAFSPPPLAPDDGEP